MTIGEQIKEKRTERQMTQEELAQQLNVARSTISNWEINRNYPDIETIIRIAEIFEMSLDELLRGDQEVVQKLTADTTMRKKQTRRLKIVYGLVAVLLLFPAANLIELLSRKDLSNSSHVEAVKVLDDELYILTNLPVYRSVTGYMMNPTFEDSTVVEIAIMTAVDFSFENKDNVIIPIRDSQIINDQVRKINIIDNDHNVVKSFSTK